MKVEEKKLQQEQETNTLYIGAMFATIQPPVITESKSRVVAGINIETAEPAAQTALPVDSAKSVNVSSRQNAQLNNKPVVTQQTAAPKAVTAKIQSNPPASIAGPAKTNATTENVISSNQGSSLKTQIPLPNTGDSTSTENIGSQSAAQAKETMAKNISPTAEHKITVVKTKEQTTSPVTENQQPASVSTVNDRVAPVATLIPNTENPIGKAGVRIAVHAKENNPISIPLSSKANIIQTRLGETKVADESKTIEKQSETKSVEKTKTSNMSKVTSDIAQVIKGLEESNDSQTDTLVSPTAEITLPVAKTNIPNVKVISSDTASQNENTSVVIDSEINPNQKTLTTETKSVETAQTKATVVDVPQPVGRFNIPVAKVVFTDASVQSENEPVTAETKPAESVQTSVSVIEVSYSVNKANLPATKVVVAQIEDKTVVFDNESSANQKTFGADKKLVESSQTNIPAVEVPQPVTKSNIPVAEKFVPEAKSTDQNPVTRVAEQKEVSNITPAPSPTVFSPGKTEVDAQVAKAAQPMTKPISRIEDSHMAETILKTRDGQAVTSLGDDNATDGSRLGTGNRPKVSNEPFVFVQENVPASIQSETVAQSTQIEIKSDEKVSTKEVDRKSALDLESIATVIGADKGTISIKAAEKSSVAQIDTTAMDVIQQITSQMKARIKSGETSISMKLNPEKLGAIEVQMTHNAQGVSVSFITEQASTGQLLESQVSQLRQSLKDAGVQLTNLNISQHHQPHQEGGSFKQGQSFVQNPRRDIPQAETVNDQRMRPQRIGGLTSEIDYLI